MAKPKIHIISTGFLLIFWLIFYFPLAIISMDWVVAIAITFWGILVDIDHISSLKPQKIKDRSWLSNPEHLDWLHTFWGLAAAIATSLSLWNILPFVSFTIHMLIDGGNKYVLEAPEKGPLLTKIHRFYPKWAKYLYTFK